MSTVPKWGGVEIECMHVTREEGAGLDLGAVYSCSVAIEQRAGRGPRLACPQGAPPPFCFPLKRSRSRAKVGACARQLTSLGPVSQAIRANHQFHARASSASPVPSPPARACIGSCTKRNRACTTFHRIFTSSFYPRPRRSLLPPLLLQCQDLRRQQAHRHLLAEED